MQREGQIEQPAGPLQQLLQLQWEPQFIHQTPQNVLTFWELLRTFLWAATNCSWQNQSSLKLEGKIFFHLCSCKAAHLLQPPWLCRRVGFYSLAYMQIFLLGKHAGFGRQQPTERTMSFWLLLPNEFVSMRKKMPSGGLKIVLIAGMFLPYFSITLSTFTPLLKTAMGEKIAEAASVIW